MAKQTGLIKVNGTLDGVSFYIRKGQLLSRLASGPSKHKIETHPHYIRTRENNREFGGSAKAGRALRLGLAPVYRHMADSDAAPRIVKLSRDIMNRDTVSLRGQRSFQPVQQRDLLLNFGFKERVSFDQLFHAPFTSEVHPERHQVTVLVPDFHTGRLINAPRGATHVRLVHVVSALSAFVYNPVLQSYEAVDAANNGKNAVSTSAFLPLGEPAGADQALITQVPGLAGMPDSTALVSCLGIEFYQESGGMMYLLASDHAMKVQGVY